jgi:hypothetical protein
MKKSCLVRYTGELESCDMMSDIKLRRAFPAVQSKVGSLAVSRYLRRLILAKSSHEMGIPRSNRSRST